MERVITANLALNATTPPIPHDDWNRVDARLDGGRLVWRYSRGEMTPEGKPLAFSARATVPKQTPDDPYVRQPLEDFMRLYNRSDEEVLAFVEKYRGVLELCVHGYPIVSFTVPHPDDTVEIQVSKDVSVFGASARTAYRAGCDIPRTDDGDYWESPDEWRRFSREALAILAIADAARRGEAGSDEDWEAMLGHKFSPGYRDSVGQPPSPDRARFAVATSVNGWLEAGRVRPTISWEGATPAVSFGSHSLFGTLALQLAAAVGRWGLATCDVCGCAYFPKRQPARGRHKYCGDRCRKRAAPRLSRQGAKQRKQRTESRSKTRLR